LNNPLPDRHVSKAYPRTPEAAMYFQYVLFHWKPHEALQAAEELIGNNHSVFPAKRIGLISIGKIDHFNKKESFSSLLI
jgi:hypothetical protein